MVTSTRPRAYVSSTYDDLGDARRVVARVLREFGYEDLSLDYHSEPEQGPVDARLRAVAECDLFVLIIAWRYGEIPEQDNPTRRSLVELEYDRAVEARKPRLTFVLDPNAPWPSKSYDSKRARILEFRERLLRAEFVTFFADVESLDLAVSKALNWETTARVQRPLAPSPEEIETITAVANAPERVARLLVSLVLADRSRLALLESPNSAGLSDALASRKAQHAAAISELIGRMNDERFEPDPLWLAWVTNIHRERLVEIGTELLRVSGITTVA